MVSKSTHKETITLYAPIIKETEGNYIAVLSDDSIDRDGEIMDKSCYQKIMESDAYTAALMDHENKIMNQVGEWVNKRIVEVDGRTAFVAEPKFYLSNPNAVIIKGMLDEGAKMGISIGATPKKWIDKKVDGITRTVYTDLELLEASFVAIPSNRHGMVTAVAKMAKSFNKESEVNNKMSEELQKKLDDANGKYKSLSEEKAELEKSFAESKESLEKAVSEKAELVKQLEEANNKASEEKAELEKAHSEAMEKAVAEKEELQKQLEVANKKALFKGNFEDMDQEQKTSLEKNLAEGKIPVFKQ